MTQIIYDDECPVCQSLKSFAEQNSPGGNLAFIPFQGNDLPRGMTVKQASQSLQVITKNGQRVSGARAVFQVMRELSGIWGLVGKVFSIPPFYWLAEPFYRLFARHRHKLSAWLDIDGG